MISLLESSRALLWNTTHVGNPLLDIPHVIAYELVEVFLRVKNALMANIKIGIISWYISRCRKSSHVENALMRFSRKDPNVGNPLMRFIMKFAHGKAHELEIPSRYSSRVRNPLMRFRNTLIRFNLVEWFKLEVRFRNPHMLKSPNDEIPSCYTFRVRNPIMRLGRKIPKGTSLNALHQSHQAYTKYCLVGGGGLLKRIVHLEKEILYLQ
ncbi:hypothetical protein DPMN_006222 [Dreissena polymorpha]|uniref:Uncharacterized protein n=1 Tax=Dreissena polymorpha TaxID=45954 RepID=A0A9D4MRK6_DREPO|nr:hypothetical protein DPMN_006222 [Dreissena polymorpha]